MAKWRRMIVTQLHSDSETPEEENPHFKWGL